MMDQNQELMQKLAAVSIWRTPHEVGFVAASTQRAEKWFDCRKGEKIANKNALAQTERWRI